MAVGALFEADGFTQQDYEAVSAIVGDGPMEGGLLHVAGPSEGGWRVFEVWESEDAQRRFQEDRLDPAFDQAGKPRVTPKLFPVNVMFPPPEALAGLAAGGAP